MIARHRLTASLLIAFIVLALSMLPSFVACAHTVLRDIEYAVVDDLSLRLDLYLPTDRPEDTVPLVIWVHGGGWRAGTKDQTQAPGTLGEDYAIASVEYRLSDVAIFPAQIHDVKAAVRWLRAHAHDYGFDPQRFGAWGSSAGGHLVALLGVSCGNPDLEGTIGEYLDESSCVQAVCDFYGPTDFLSLMAQRGVGPMRRPQAEDLLLGGLVEDVLELAALASPITHISPDDPPFLIMHGSDDGLVPVEQSIAFDEMLQAAGVDSTLIVIDGEGHGFPREHLSAVKPWFDDHLGIQPMSGEGEDEGEDEDVDAFHRKGQTFLTWSEGTGNWVAIYRADHDWASTSDLVDEKRLAIVAKGSSVNERASVVEKQSLTYVIREGEPALPSDVGLFVHTTMTSSDATYAVAACTQTGEVLEWIGSVGPIAEQVGVPAPVLQSVHGAGDSLRAHYVHWGPSADTAVAQAFANRPNQAFNFVVWEPAEPESEGAAVFALHGGGGSYASASAFATFPSVTVVSPDSYVPGAPDELDRTWDAWYGYNDNVGTGQPLSEGVNIDYTTRRLKWMAQWLVLSYPEIDESRIFLRGSSMGGVGTVFSSVFLRDTFAAGLAIVPRFDYGAEDVFLESFETFGTRWGSIEDNLLTSDGMGVFDRMDAGFVAHEHPEWDFAPVWAFNGRNDTAVGWSEKIPFYEVMNASRHGWVFFWDARAHGGQAPYPKAWRENGWEDEIFDWMINTIRLDQSYPAFSNCSVDDNPGTGDPTDGDPIGTINGYLRWDAASLKDDEEGWAIDLFLHPDASGSCLVDVTPRRLQSFRLDPGQRVFFQVLDPSDIILLQGEEEVDGLGLLTVRQIPITVEGVRLQLATALN